MRDAWFVWDEIILEKVKQSLRVTGMSDEEMAAKMYYDFAFFRMRVPRIVPPPCKLYWRVRAVYEVYGPLQDGTGKPLFNNAAWAKADNVLKEIIAGLASDPPDFIFYRLVIRSPCTRMRSAGYQSD
jgi:hypothetical protein